MDFFLFGGGSFVLFAKELTFWYQLALGFVYFAFCIAYSVYLFLWFDKRVRNSVWKDQQKKKLKHCIDKGILPFVALHGTWIGILFFLIWIVPIYIIHPEMNFPLYKLLFLGLGYPVVGFYWFLIKIRYEKMNSK